MKKRKRAAFAAAAAMAAVLLAACGGKTDQRVRSESEEIVAPEISSEDLLVSSLEYLLEEEKDAQSAGEQAEEEQEMPEQAADVPEETEADVPTESGDGAPEQPQVEAVIYYGNGGSADLSSETVMLGELTADALIDALARHNIVTLLDTKVLSFEAEEQDGKKLLHLDLSKAFGEYLRTMSKEAEQIIVSSLVNTFLENYGADGIYITVEGAALATSNEEYTEALERFMPGGAEEPAGGAAQEEHESAEEADGGEETEQELPSTGDNQ